MSDQIKFHEQDEGWTHSYLPGGNCVCFERPREIGGGLVTVDFKRRIFSCGYGMPRLPATDVKYSGSGWKNRIIRDAISHLEKVMTT